MIQENLTNLISNLGENIVIRKLEYINEKIGSLEKYFTIRLILNSGKIGVLMSLNQIDKTENVY